MSAQAPVGTTLALLERQLKIMGAVQARLHNAMKIEFKLLKSIIADYTPDSYDYDPEEGGRDIKRSDYDMVEVMPVSDPNAATMAQKIVQYQAVFQLAQSAPNIYNLPLLHRQMIEVLGVKNAAKLVPIEDDLKPVDPVQENQNFLTIKPNKAFIEQDHAAHIATHMSMMQNPAITGMLQNSPVGQQIQAAVTAHINEHLAFQYRKEVEASIGLLLPTKEQSENMDPATAAQVAQLTAQASQRLAQQAQAAVAQQQAQQKAQDPIIQMQMQELQLKMEDLKLKAQKQAADVAAKADQLRIEEARIAAQKEIAAMQVGATAAAARDKVNKNQMLEGARLGVEIAKSRAQMAVQAAQKSAQTQRPPRKEKD
jgi:hypothetical protein